MSDVQLCFFFNDTATTEIYTLSLHDALPISFIVNGDGLGWLFAPVGLRDGPLPVHYEPVESPVPNLLYEKIRYDPAVRTDRKSTRLNSSHANISYAVFCLKKKKRYTVSLTCS